MRHRLKIFKKVQEILMAAMLLLRILPLTIQLFRHKELPPVVFKLVKQSQKERKEKVVIPVETQSLKIGVVKMSHL